MAIALPGSMLGKAREQGALLARAAEIRSRWPRRAPFTIALIGSIWVLAVATGSLHGGVPAGIQNRLGFAPSDLLHYRAYTALSMVFFIPKAYMAFTITFALLLFLLPYELAAGTWRALAVFWGAHVAETLLAGTAIVLLAARDIGAAQTLRDAADVGASAGAFGCAGALLTVVPRRWRVAGALALAAYLLGFLVLHHKLYDIDHVLVTPLGFGIGWLIRARPPSVSWRARRGYDHG